MYRLTYYFFPGFPTTTVFQMYLDILITNKIL